MIVCVCVREREGGIIERMKEEAKEEPMRNEGV
jgi:hypothetical protein